MRSRPVAVFMAFGTKGDVYPLAAIATAFACDWNQHDVLFITHSVHENIRIHMEANRVGFIPILSPPVLGPPNEYDMMADDCFSCQKKAITRDHRRQCLSSVEKIFGDDLSIHGDTMIINFFALEGWSLAELFHVPCIVAAPYVVPYSAPSSFESRFRIELPLLYKYLKEAPAGKVGWKDVIHWMWPLFTEEWTSWRCLDLNLSSYPFTDPVTGLPAWQDRPPCPLLLYGFSEEVVECPAYWPSRARVCGFWFLPMQWQFSCNGCAEIYSFRTPLNLNTEFNFCPSHKALRSFLYAATELPIFIGLSSVGSMGFMKNPRAFLRVIEKVIGISSHRFLLFSAGHEPLDAAVDLLAHEESPGQICKDGASIFSGRLFCYSGSMPYNLLFQRCAAVVHHGGSGSTAASLYSGIPQVVCPFLFDQFYWAERMFWIGVAPEPLSRNHLLPDKDDDTGTTLAAELLNRALNITLSPEVRACALDIAKRLSAEDGVSTAVQILKEELSSYLSKKNSVSSEKTCETRTTTIEP